MLAIAVLGMVMVHAFGSRLNITLAHLPLSGGIPQQLRTEEIKLAALPLPEGLDPGTRAAIQESICEAFVFGFRTIMLICAGLSLASATVAWFMIPNAPNASNTNKMGTGATH